MTNNITYRIEQLEKNYCDLDGKLNSILTNHLPHLKEDIASLKTEVRLLSVLNVGAIVLGIFVAKMLG